MTSSSADELLTALARENEEPPEDQEDRQIQRDRNRNINSINRTNLVSPRSFCKKIERQPSTTTFGNEKSGPSK